MTHRNLVVVGGSAGGLEVTRRILSGLPPDFPAGICVVMHIPARSPSRLATFLGRGSVLPVSDARHEQPIEPAHVYVAPPDVHLTVKPGAMLLRWGPKENRHRPAVDPLFRSAAKAYGPRAVGVIVSGNLDDGAVGLAQIKRAGGLTIVQDPDEAQFSGMPTSALERVEADYVVAADHIAGVLVKAVSEPLMERVANPGDSTSEAGPELMEPEAEPIQPDGPPSSLTCPECRGPLWELHDEGWLRFRCRTGHTYSPATLLAEQDHNLEKALWYAIEAVKERIDLSHRLAARMHEMGRHDAARRFRSQALEAHQQGNVIAEALSRLATPPSDIAQSDEGRDDGNETSDAGRTGDAGPRATRPGRP